MSKLQLGKRAAQLIQ